MAAVPEAYATGAERQRRLIGLLACPRCHGKLEFESVAERFGVIVDADLRCPACGEVGVIRSYRPSFHQEDLGAGWLAGGYAEEPIDVCQGSAAVGDWVELPLGSLGQSVGSCLTGETDRAGVVFALGTHDWGGAALVSCGDEERRVELYSPTPGFARVVFHQPDALGERRRWSIVVAPGATSRNESHVQAIVHYVAELVPASEAPALRHEPDNRGNPYPPRFAEMLAAARTDAVVLDLGGGDRCHEDPRVLNFEYMHFRCPDFFGDGLHLPIADNSVDLIMSQAVLEHVSDPQRAVDEMRRVLRPGGSVYAEFAFMQPLHAVPYHFFNITPHGAALLFEQWEVLDTGVFGGLGVTVDWFFELIAAKSKIGGQRVATVLDALRDLDAQLTTRELEHVASAVYVEAIKPG